MREGVIATAERRHYDPQLTERLLEQGNRLLGESRRLLDDLDDRLDEDEPDRTAD